MKWTSSRFSNYVEISIFFLSNIVNKCIHARQMERDAQTWGRFWRFLGANHSVRRKRRVPSQTVNIPLITLSPEHNEDQDMDIVSALPTFSNLVLMCSFSVVKTAWRSHHFFVKQTRRFQLSPAVPPTIQESPRPVAGRQTGLRLTPFNTSLSKK